MSPHANKLSGCTDRLLWPTGLWITTIENFHKNNEKVEQRKRQEQMCNYAFFSVKGMSPDLKTT